MSKRPFAPIDEVVAAIRTGEMIVLVDDEDRENEGDLVVAAEYADAAAIAFMATRGCGLICLAMEGPMLDRLGLPLMTRDNHSRFSTAFTLSIEAREGVTTGISAEDRAQTISAAISPQARPEDIVSPGHVFPLRARDGGVLVRAGQTEGSVDLARLAGLTPAAVICEIMKSDGSMARLPDLIPYCEEHGLKLASIADLIAWREARESLVELVAEGQLASRYGEIRAYTYRSKVSGEHHLALVLGDVAAPGTSAQLPVLVRVQPESVLADVLHGAEVPGTGAIDGALQQLSQEGGGVLLYMRDPRGAHLPQLLHELGGIVHREQPLIEPPMDPRSYGIGAQILRHLGVRSMRLIASHPQHLHGLGGYGLEIVEHIVPLAPDGGTGPTGY